MTELEGKYRLIQSLGTGAGGETFEAEDVRDGARVALKRLVLANTSDWKRVDLFQREAKVLASLQHPAIPRYRDSFVVETPQGPVSYLAHDFAPGKSLRGWFEAGWRPNEGDIVRIGAFLLDVLAHLHSLHPAVIHRDIKPANVIRSEDDRLWLVDFGAVRDATTDAAGGSTVAGTYGYMAPEQFRGQAIPASDVYGVGATLLFLLGGKSPTEYPQEKLRVAFRGHVRISPFIARWLERALEPAPEDRFANASEALAALRGERPAQKPTSGRGRIFVLAGLLGAIVLGTGGFIANDLLEARRLKNLSQPTAKSAARTAPMTRLPRAFPPAREMLSNRYIFEGGHTNLVTSLAVSPDSKQFASGSEGSVKLWDIERAVVTQTLGGHEGKVGSLRYTKDGSKLVSAGGKSVRIWNTKSGAQIASIAQTTAWALALSTDDKTIFSAFRDGIVRAYDVESQKELRTFAHGTSVFALAVTPDGTRLASGGADGKIVLWSLESGARIAAWQPHTKTIGRIRFSPDGSLIASAADDGLASVEVLHANGTTEHRFDIAFDDEAWEVRFTPDGRTLAASGKTGEIMLADAITGRSRGSTMTGAPTGEVAFTNDGGMALVGMGGYVARFTVPTRGRGTILPQPKPDAPTARTPRDKGHALFIEALQLIHERKLDVADTKINEALAWKPASSSVAAAQARLTMRRGYRSGSDYDPDALKKARAQLDATTAPKTPEWWTSVSFICRVQKDFACAHDAIRQATALDPADLFTKLADAYVAESEGHYGIVVERASEVLRATKERALVVDAYQPLDTAYSHIGDLDGADAVYRGLIALEPEEPFHHGNYANFLVGAGDYDKAIDEAHKALGLMEYGVARSTLAWALANRGDELLWGQGDLDGAARSYDEAIKVDPTRMTAFYGRAAVARARAWDTHDLSRLKVARADLEQAKKLDQAKKGHAGAKHLQDALADLDELEKRWKAGK